MKRLVILSALILSFINTRAGVKDSTIYYSLPDSVKAVQFMTEIRIGDFGKTKHCRTGIRTDAVTLIIDNYSNQLHIRFYAKNYLRRKVTGIGTYVDLKDAYFNYPYKWKTNTSYKLLISAATDSASNISLYSGYVFLPEENKWKLIGTYEISGYAPSLLNPSSFFIAGKKYNSNIATSQAWVQRNNGSWKTLKDETMTPPLINMYGHIDSIRQRQVEEKQIQDAIAVGKTDAIKNHNGIYYTMLKEGTGPQVAVTDTVVAFYKGYLFADGTVFDQTKEKPATFPLGRLIKGWQVGLPLCKVGGKIKLVIPSDMAYSIRTRAAKIPPNSTLVFEIEVVETKPVK